MSQSSMESLPPHLQQIIDRCLQNDRKAQQQLYEMYAGKMLAICLRYCGDYQTAQDLMHDGFIKVFTNIGQFKNTGSFDGWMRKVMVNCSLNYYRQSQFVVDSYEETISMVDDTLQPDQLQQLGAKEIIEMIGRLPSLQRIVFNLFVIEGYSHAEIADKLQIKETTIRSNYLRARHTLQKMIEQNNK